MCSCCGATDIAEDTASTKLVSSAASGATGASCTERRLVSAVVGSSGDESVVFAVLFLRRASALKLKITDATPLRLRRGEELLLGAAGV